MKLLNRKMFQVTLGALLTLGGLVGLSGVASATTTTNTVAPVASGSYEVDGTVSVTDGTWTNAGEFKNAPGLKPGGILNLKLPLRGPSKSDRYGQDLGSSGDTDLCAIALVEQRDYGLYICGLGYWRVVNCRNDVTLLQPCAVGR